MTFETLMFWFGIAFCLLIVLAIVIAVLEIFYVNFILPSKRETERQQYEIFVERYKKENMK